MEPDGSHLEIAGEKTTGVTTTHFKVWEGLGEKTRQTLTKKPHTKQPDWGMTACTTPEVQRWKKSRRGGET